MPKTRTRPGASSRSLDQEGARVVDGGRKFGAAVVEKVDDEIGRTSAGRSERWTAAGRKSVEQRGPANGRPGAETREEPLRGSTEVGNSSGGDGGGGGDEDKGRRR